jgi:hypothetical protein
LQYEHGEGAIERLSPNGKAQASACWKLILRSALRARANSTQGSVKSIPVTLATLAISGNVNAKLPVPQPTSSTRSSSERPPIELAEVRVGGSIFP